MQHAVETLSRCFRLSPSAASAVEVAFANFSRKTGTGEWPPAEFSEQLKNWLVSESLLPVHVAPEEFRSKVEELATL